MGKQESEAQRADEALADGGSGSRVETWLRKAARAPDAHARITLPHPGQVIGDKYRIDSELGRGGMGAVYRATHVVSGKKIALKWMLRSASDGRAQERFSREARAAGRIDHPNVIDIYDIGQSGDAAYLVMELLHGESLRSRLIRGPLGVSELIDLILPALRGVAAVHREGVIHRDLKPDNIFLCRGPGGEEREAKVLDFGISTITHSTSDDKATLTKAGAVVGTPSYMSPEQLQSASNADERSDVYAFGVILYEGLTSELPFAGDSYSALVLAIANGSARPLRDFRAELPVELERVVLRAMAADRDTRHANIDALIAALMPFASTKSAGSGNHPSYQRESSRSHDLAALRRFGIRTALAIAFVATLLGYRWLRGATATPVASTPNVQSMAPSTAPTISARLLARPMSPPPAAPQLAAAAVKPIETSGPATDLRQPTRQRDRRPARPPDDSTQAPALQPLLETAPTRKGRSGTITIDDL